MSKKRTLIIAALLLFLISMTLVVMKMQSTKESPSPAPTTNIQEVMSPQPLKAPAISRKTEDSLRQLFREAEEWVADVEERRVEAQNGDQRMGYGAAVDAAEEALTKLEAYQDSMTTAQIEKLTSLRERLDE